MLFCWISNVRLYCEFGAIYIVIFFKYIQYQQYLIKNSTTFPRKNI